MKSLPCAGKSTLSVVSFAPYSWFEEWKDGKVKNRGDDYEELKETIINSVLELLTQIFPEIKDKVQTFTSGNCNNTSAKKSAAGCY